MEKIKVAINGYGTIGRRVAYAIEHQPDMELVGIAKMGPDFKAAEMVAQNIPLFAAAGKEAFAEAGMPVAGTVSDMLALCDVVLDCSPKKVGKENAKLYAKFPNVKAIYQGGEKNSIAPVSFNAQCNYDESRGQSAVRVVSCNTTALCRVINTLRHVAPIKKVRVAIARRAADPDDTGKGLINAWMPVQEFPSHHAHDFTEVIADIPIVSLAGLAPMSIMHGHMLFIEFDRSVSRQHVIAALSENPRILMLAPELKIESTAHIKEMQGARPFTDVYEACIWEASIGSDGTDVGLHIAVDQRAIVVPETIDAIRAVMGTMSAEESMKTTEQTLGMKSIAKLKVMSE